MTIVLLIIIVIQLTAVMIIMMTKKTIMLVVMVHTMKVWKQHGFQVIVILVFVVSPIIKLILIVTSYTQYAVQPQLQSIISTQLLSTALNQHLYQHLCQDLMTYLSTQYSK